MFLSMPIEKFDLLNQRYEAACKQHEVAYPQHYKKQPAK